jgi:hypothetical protein
MPIAAKHQKLAAAVRKSLNLPDLEVGVRRTGERWLFQLHLKGAASEWLELGPDDIRVMNQLGLLPALHLGMFRVAYAGLRRASQPGTL